MLSHFMHRLPDGAWCPTSPTAGSHMGANPPYISAREGQSRWATAGPPGGGESHEGSAPGSSRRGRRHVWQCMEDCRICACATRHEVTGSTRAARQGVLPRVRHKSSLSCGIASRIRAQVITVMDPTPGEGPHISANASWSTTLVARSPPGPLVRSDPAAPAPQVRHCMWSSP
jgi:hypothetical protein